MHSKKTEISLKQNRTFTYTRKKNYGRNYQRAKWRIKRTINCTTKKESTVAEMYAWLDRHSLFSGLSSLSFVVCVNVCMRCQAYDAYCWTMNILLCTLQSQTLTEVSELITVHWICFLVNWFFFVKKKFESWRRKATGIIIHRHIGEMCSGHCLL